MDSETCDACGGTIHIGDYPFCGGDAAKHVPAHPQAVPDEIPGGLEIKNGLCNEDGTPRKYYSRSEIAKEAKRRGWMNYVVHVPQRGSDKSPHTSRWV